MWFSSVCLPLPLLDVIDLDRKHHSYAIGSRWQWFFTLHEGICLFQRLFTVFLWLPKFRFLLYRQKGFKKSDESQCWRMLRVILTSEWKFIFWGCFDLRKDRHWNFPWRTLLGWLVFLLHNVRREGLLLNQSGNLCGVSVFAGQRMPGGKFMQTYSWDGKLAFLLLNG